MNRKYVKVRPKEVHVFDFRRIYRSTTVEFYSQESMAEGYVYPVYYFDRSLVRKNLPEYTIRKLMVRIEQVAVVLDHLGRKSKIRYRGEIAG